MGIVELSRGHGID